MGTRGLTGRATRHVFLSYRRADTPKDAERLRADLARVFGRERVFLDTHSLPAGVDFAQAIDETIDACDVVVAMIGKQWIGPRPENETSRIHDLQDHVRLEIEKALGRQIKIIPVLVDGAAVPSAHDVPDSIHPLLRFHAIDLTQRRWAEDVEVLVKYIRETPRRTPMETGEMRRIPWRRRRHLRFALAAMVALVAGAVSLLWLGRAAPNPPETSTTTAIGTTLPPPMVTTTTELPATSGVTTSLPAPVTGSTRPPQTIQPSTEDTTTRVPPPPPYAGTWAGTVTQNAQPPQINLTLNLSAGSVNSVIGTYQITTPSCGGTVTFRGVSGGVTSVTLTPGSGECDTLLEATLTRNGNVLTYDLTSARGPQGTISDASAHGDPDLATPRALVDPSRTTLGDASQSLDATEATRSALGLGG